MGCGCASSRATLTSECQQYSSAPYSPERLAYLLRKQKQVARLFESLVLTHDTHPELDEYIAVLSKGCQGFTTTPTGGETSLIKRCIDQLMGCKIPTERVVDSFLGFVKDAGTEIGELENKYGRYHQGGSQYLLRALCALAKEQVLGLATKDPAYLTSFLFCALGTFRYAAGLNFRGGVKDDKNARRFVIRMHKHLVSINKSLYLVPSKPLPRKFKKDFAQLAALSDLFKLQDPVVETKSSSLPRERNTFDSLLSEFANAARPSPLFSEPTLTQVFNALSQRQSLRPDKSEGKLESRASTPACRPTPNPSPFIILLGTQPTTYSHILVDVLFEGQQKSPGKDFEIIGEHYCCDDNCVTQISRYVFGNFLECLSTRNKMVGGFLECVEYDMCHELFPEKVIRRKTERVVAEVFELLRPLPVPRNLVYVVHNAELLDESFFKTMRRCRDIFPAYTKLLLVMNKGQLSLKAMSMLSGATNIQITTVNFMPELYAYIAKKYTDKPDEELLKTFRDCVANSMEKLKAIFETLHTKSALGKKRLQKRQAMEIFVGAGAYGRAKKIAKIAEAMKQMEKYAEKEVIEKIVLFLLEARSPIPIYLLEEWLSVTSPTMAALGDFIDLFGFSAAEILPDTTIRLLHKKLWCEVFASKMKDTQIATLTAILEQCWETAIANESLVEVPEYYRLSAVTHYTRLVQLKKSLDNKFLSPFWLFSQIDCFKSFDFVLSELDAMLGNTFDRGIQLLRNHLYVIEGVFAGKSLSISDFYTQLHSRLLNEGVPMMKGMIGMITGAKLAYFRPYHPALKENNNLDCVLETDSDVAAMFCSDGYLVYATGKGLLYIHLVPTYELLYQYLIDSGICSLCYIKDGHFLVGGANQFLYMWTIKGQAGKNPEGKIECHPDGTRLIVCGGGYFFTAGVDNAIYRGSIEPFAIEKKGQPGKVPINTLEVCKNSKGEGPTASLVLAGLANGAILVLDSSLNLVSNVTQNEGSIISLNSMNTKDSFLSGSADGEINVFDASTTVATSTLTIFHITQEDIVAVLLFEKQSLLVGVEKRSIRIYKPNSCSLLDEWLYIFKADIRTAVKSSDETYLMIGDSEGKLCVFDMTKPAEQRFALGIPSHRADYGISFILYTTAGIGHHQHLITCSGEREVKVWSRDSCKFIKKYNLASVATDVITAAAIDKVSQNIIYLGCKDTNIYRVDLSQGVASEPLAEQYTRITSLRTSNVNSHILICLAEKNVLVWSTKSRHPITEFSEHKANVIYIRDVENAPSTMESIDASFRYIRWDWESREVASSLELYPQAASYLEEEIALLATIIQALAFVATSSGYIRVFSLKDNVEMGSTMIQDREMPVALESVNVATDTYLLLVTKTTASLYKVEIDKSARVELQLLCGTRLNSTVAKEGVVKDNKLLYTLYFTAAALLVIDDDEEPGEPSAGGTVSERNTGGLESMKGDIKIKPEKMEESKVTPLATSTLAKGSTFEQSAGTSNGASVIKKEENKKRALMVYLADSKAFLHVYRVSNLQEAGKV